jgi:hypothetical protein
MNKMFLQQTPGTPQGCTSWGSQMPSLFTKGHSQVSAEARAISGFVFGLVLMRVMVHVFCVNTHDFRIFQQGTRALWSGVDPWAPDTLVVGFYNPPFSMLFMWPFLLTTPLVMIVFGGGLLFAFAFYHRSWVALTWFATHTCLWVVAAGGMDMYLLGMGLLLLLLSDRSHQPFWTEVGRILAYGFLLVKPQGGVFIVAIYVLLRRDWIGAIASLIFYSMPFAHLYRDWWLYTWRTDIPVAQIEAAHSLGARFGPALSIPVALAVLFARRWKYWQLGGALAGILAPYGMPGVPILLVLTALDKLAAIPALLIYSGCLAALTWIAPQSPVMGIYHLGMLGLALILACLLPAADGEDADTIDAAQALKRCWASLGGRLKR